MFFFFLFLFSQVLAGERAPLWDSMTSCQEVQLIMETKAGRRRGEMYTGRCDPNVSFAQAPRPWDIVRLLDEQRPSLEACVQRSRIGTFYSANVHIVVRPPGTFGYYPKNTVEVVNSTAGETPSHTLPDLGSCIMSALGELTFPDATENYTITWHFSVIPPDRDLLNLDGILTVPEVDRLEPEIEQAPPP